MVHQFSKANKVSLEFFPNYFLIKDSITGAVLARGPCSEGVYGLDAPLTSSESKMAALGMRTTPHHWHPRLGHPSRQTSSVILSKFNLPFLNKLDTLIDDCVSCSVSKTHRLPFGGSFIIATSPLNYLYVDIWGPRLLFLLIVVDISCLLLTFLVVIVGFIY